MAGPLLGESKFAEVMSRSISGVLGAGLEALLRVPVATPSWPMHFQLTAGHLRRVPRVSFVAAAQSCDCGSIEMHGSAAPHTFGI